MNFSNVIYSKILVSMRDSADGETATILYVTKEVNGWAVFIDGHNGVQFLKWEPYIQNNAIEYGVDYGRKPEIPIEGII